MLKKLFHSQKDERSIFSPFSTITITYIPTFTLYTATSRDSKQGKAMSYQMPPFTQWEKDWVKIGFLVFLKNIMLKHLRILPKWLLDVKFDLSLCFELPRSLEAAEAIRGRGQIWHPEVRASHLSIIYGGLGGSRSLERPRAASDLKSGRTASRLVSRW